MPDIPQFERLLSRAEAVLGQIEASLPPAVPSPDWETAIALRWRTRNGRGWLQAVRHPHPIRLADLTNIDDQKARIVANTRQFVAGQPANNVLLTGTRGSGKSSLVKAVLNEFSDRGLRLIEVDKDELVDLPDIVDLLEGRPERFIIFCRCRALGASTCRTARRSASTTPTRTAIRISRSAVCWSTAAN